MCQVGDQGAIGVLVSVVVDQTCVVKEAVVYCARVVRRRGVKWSCDLVAILTQVMNIIGEYHWIFWNRGSL